MLWDNFFDDETESWVQTVHVNYLGIVWGIKAFLPRMIDAGDEGMVLATGSPSASEGTTYGAPAYSASKAALLLVMESLYGQLRDRKSGIRVAVAFPLLTATNIGGNPRMMHVASEQQRARGLPTVLVQADQVAGMIVDGIKQGRFFITMRKQDNDAFFGGAHSDDFFAWREKMVRGRSEAQLNNGTPDSYIW